MITFRGEVPSLSDQGVVVDSVGSPLNPVVIAPGIDNKDASITNTTKDQKDQPEPTAKNNTLLIAAILIGAYFALR